MNVPVYVFEIKPEFSRLKKKQNYIHLVYLDMRESIWLIFLAYKFGMGHERESSLSDIYFIGTCLSCIDLMSPYDLITD